MRKVTFNDIENVWELTDIAQETTVLPTIEPHYCKKGLHNLSLPEARLKDGRCLQCRRDREGAQRSFITYRDSRQRLLRRIRAKRAQIKLLEEELDRILYE